MATVYSGNIDPFHCAEIARRGLGWVLNITITMINRATLDLINLQRLWLKEKKKEKEKERKER